MPGNENNITNDNNTNYQYYIVKHYKNRPQQLLKQPTTQ